MAKTLLIKTESAVLKHARKYSGFTLDQVAEKLKAKLEILEGYESETSEIPLTRLEKLTSVYKRPLAFFLLKKVPDDVIEDAGFRIVYASPIETALSPKAYLALRRARYIQSIITEFAEVDSTELLSKASISDDPNKLSSLLRETIGRDIEEQQKWSTPSIALREWKNALEAKGIFVLQQSLPEDKISAFCLVEKKPYVIMLNSYEHENRRMFSLFHEVGHILLRQSGICTPEDLTRNSREYVRIETFCNQFSASLLLPENNFAENPDVIRLSRTPFESWDDEDFKKIAQRFKVSKEVVLRRFFTLRYIDQNAYDAKRNEWLKQSDEFKGLKKKKVIIPQHIKCLSQNGRAFTTFVLDQYHSNKITFSNAAEILNIGSKYVQKLEAGIKR